MQINNVSNLNFESSGYYISPKARKDAGRLLQLMKNNTKHKRNIYNQGWQTEILSSLKMDKVSFSNARLFVEATKDSELNKKIPDCTLNVGKSYLNINSTTGEVLSYRTGFFTSLSNLVANADKYLKALVDNFNNSDVVKKNTFELSGYFEFIK